MCCNHSIQNQVRTCLVIRKKSHTFVFFGVKRNPRNDSLTKTLGVTVELVVVDEVSTMKADVDKSSGSHFTGWIQARALKRAKFSLYVELRWEVETVSREIDGVLGRRNTKEKEKMEDRMKEEERRNEREEGKQTCLAIRAALAPTKTATKTKEE